MARRFRPRSLFAMKSFFEMHRALLVAVVFTIAVLLTAPGIGNQTGPTSKDEYHRVFRTALSMIEENVWLVPVLDGSPRIEKPPLLNWLSAGILSGSGCRC